MRTGRILLVDDEAPLLDLMRKFLSRLGYEVDTCERGGQAWDLFTGEAAAYALVIVDLALPDMPGKVLLERMLEHNPNIHALVCSGSPDSGSFAAHARVSYLQKPFLPKMLAEKVESVLGAG